MVGRAKPEEYIYIEFSGVIKTTEGSQEAQRSSMTIINRVNL